MDDVTKVINKIEGDKLKVIGWLDIPKSVLEEIEKRYFTDSEKSHAYSMCVCTGMETTKCMLYDLLIQKS